MASIQKKSLVQAGRMVCAVLFFVLMAAANSRAQCVASGPNSPGTATNTGSGVAFANATNVFASDDSRAEATPGIVLLNGQTEDLNATNFGFSIPLTAIICGIEVEVEKSATKILPLLATYITDLSVRLTKTGFTTTANYADAATHWTTTEGISSYGGVNDIWGTTWTPAEINSPDFGVSFSAAIFDLASLMPRVRIDQIQITVYYYEPPLLSFALQQFKVTPGKDHSALLQWKTTDWNESIRFSIQRSADNLSWETIAGFSQNDSAGQLYSYTDTRPLPGLSYYRLAMSNAAGEIKYSVSQRFVTPEGSTVHCYPNPFISSIHLTGVRAGERVWLTDVFGQRMALPRPAVNGAVTRLEVGHLKPGVYFVWVGDRVKRVVKLH